MLIDQQIIDCQISYAMYHLVYKWELLFLKYKLYQFKKNLTVKLLLLHITVLFDAF